MRVLVVAGLVVLTGCASSKEYTTYLAAHQAAHESLATAEKARYAAIAEIAKTSADPAARTAAVMALAMGKSGAQSVTPPAPPPQNQALQWASVLVPALTNVATGYYGYQLGVAQSNNAASSTIASYNAFGSIATSGFNALGATATAGFNSNASLGSFIQAPQPNITLSGAGVIGSGSYSYSAPVTTTTTTTTTTDSNNTTRNCQGGSGAAGGAGGGTTTGAPGGNGAAGGGATC